MMHGQTNIKLLFYFYYSHALRLQISTFHAHLVTRLCNYSGVTFHIGI